MRGRGAAAWHVYSVPCTTRDPWGYRVIGSLDKSFRGRGGVVYGTKSEEDVTDQSIGYTGCGGNAAWLAADRMLRIV